LPYIDGCVNLEDGIRRPCTEDYLPSPSWKRSTIIPCLWPTCNPVGR